MSGGRWNQLYVLQDDDHHSVKIVSAVLRSLTGLLLSTPFAILMGGDESAERGITGQRPGSLPPLNGPFLVIITAS